MVSEAPPFWWKPSDWRPYFLYPLSYAYGRIASRRLENAKRQHVDAPVLCVGNLTVGGQGKTPVAVAMAAAAKQAGFKPGFLSRGHGGSLSHPRLVDADHDLARHVGDEPLLLARHAPVAVTPDRAAGAKLLLENGIDFLIMDDGFQSARIHIDYALIVIDGLRGIGNGHVIPGGPLRAPLTDQMRLADAVLKMGEGAASDPVVRNAARAGKPVYEARTKPRPAGISGKRVLAFAGIGFPDKFFSTVEEAGGKVALTRSFGDHHIYTDEDVEELWKVARSGELLPVTTEKDAMRLRGSSESSDAFLKQVRVVEIETEFDLEDVPAQIVAETVQSYKSRRLRSGER